MGTTLGKKLFSPKIELLIIGCTLSVSAAYLQVFTILHFEILFKPFSSLILILAYFTFSEHGKDIIAALFTRE